MKKIATTLGVLLLCIGLAGCGAAADDEATLKGEWLISDTTVTVVFTGTEFKTAAVTYEYTLDTSESTIEFTQGEMTGGGTYAFTEEDGVTVLTLTEDDGEGGEKITTFEKVSDDADAEPSVEYVASDDSATEEAAEE